MEKKIIGKRIALVILCIVLLGISAVFMIFRNELRSLASLKTVDDYPMYQMNYYGDYGFDEFLLAGAESDEEIEKFVIDRLLKGFPIDIDITGAGCTAFVTKNNTGDTIMGRNFDFTYAPSLQVWTKPKNGFASVSTVNLTFAGYSKDNLPKPMGLNSFLTLAAPYLPFDGINEKGVSIALLAVPEIQMDYDENKITLNTTTMIRLVLDKASSVEEAVELMKKYNIYFSGDVYCHYLIADTTGKSIIVEYWNGELQVVESEESYQIASNFIAYNGLNIGEGYDEFDRYNTVKQTIEENDFKITREQTIDLLTDIGIYGSVGQDKLQWSVVYNLDDLKGFCFAHRNTDNIIDFALKTN